jgi:transposase
VDIAITFCQATVKELTRRLQAAFRGGNLPLIKRLSALLLLAERRPVLRSAERLGVCKQTIYNWLHAFVLDRYDSLPTRRPAGRPAKLTPAQRQRLCEFIDAGPEAAGYRTGCSPTALIQDLIVREFQRCYNVHYLAELLRHLGYSYQKARFVSDHLDEARRQHWLSVTWPSIVQQARVTQALLLFGDEASFAQWGSLG